MLLFTSLLKGKPNNLFAHHLSILKLGLPIMLAQFGIIIVGFIDNIMVGQYGSNELAAASFVNNFLSLVFILGMGFSYGLTPLVASSRQSKDGELKSLLYSSLASNFAIGVVLTLLLLWLSFHFVLLRPPKELLSLIRPYFLIQVASFPFLMLFYTYKQFAEACECTKAVMLIILFSNVINVLGNYVLIFGHLGFPSYGLVGAGISTLLARLVALVGLLFYVTRTKKFKSVFQKSLPFQKQIKQIHLKKLFGLGAPLAFQMGTEAASFSLAVILIGWLGTVALAAHQIISVLTTLGYMQYYGLAAAVCILVSKEWQQKNIVRLQQIVKAGQSILLVMAFLMGVFIISLRYPLARLFTTDTRIINEVIVLVYPVALFQFGDQLQILFANVLRGMRDVKVTAVSAAVCHLIIALTLCYLWGIHYQYGIVGVWWAFPISLSSLGLILYFRYRQIIRRSSFLDTVVR